MRKKKEEFDFEGTYQDILNQAKENGMYSDMIFQTLMKEFKRTKVLCDRMSEEITKSEVAYDEKGSKGQSVYKSNPVVKDYLAAQKNLVNVCTALEKKLANVDIKQDSDMFD